MSVTVRIPAPLRSFAGGQAEVAVAGTTVGEVLHRLVVDHPDLRVHLYTEEGSLRNFVNAYLNQEDVRHLGGNAAPVRSGDQITIVPSIAGGSGAAPATMEDSVAKAVTLSHEEIHRYSRHLIMPEVGMQGQKKLKSAKVLMIGAGGLGSPLGLYLAAAGVGRIGIVDFDVVDSTNLQRQLLHGTKDVGRSKLDSAAERLRDVNPHVEVVPHRLRLTSENALEVLEPYDVVVDGTDNFPTRYLVNDACVLLGKPNVYGSIFRFEGQASVFHAEEGPCYRCLFKEPPPPGLVPSCAEGGVLGVLPGIVGSIQALETIKLILGRGETLIGRLLLFDALGLEWRELKLRKDPECPACGESPTVTELIDYEEFCGVPGFEGARSAEEDAVPALSPLELQNRLEHGDDLVILDVREPHEWEIGNLGSKGARLLPLGDIHDRMNELDTAAEIVLMCRSGKRSAKALLQLQSAGFRKLWNLDGGILAWSDDVDPSVPKY
jgi:adenylyltransferase/sulfurtransferase